jgi:hypothetical protein
MNRSTVPAVVVLLCIVTSANCADNKRAIDTGQPGGQALTQFLDQQVREITATQSKQVDRFVENRGLYREELFEMLGLVPRPEKTDLKAVVTGTNQSDDVIVENVHFQSRPGLYVTGNLYRPAKQDGKLPAILYVCGHGGVKIDGVSYGNKVHYQHHGAWFARHGYVCLTIDTLQLGEIEGIHHGTYNRDMWWWNARGYTSAGVEAWNCIRALDYLQSRSEVDGDRIGVTGRSGGGAYSWWVSALDDRIKAAVPVAGITSLRNHVVDGCIEGHCDCMYPLNTFRRDFSVVSGLVAPRPLLISNTDKDGIFPLDGVIDVYGRTRRIYKLFGKSAHLGLQIAEGPHKDTQQLRVDAFHWFSRFLKDDDSLIESAAVPMFEPEQLRVFEELPEDELNTTIHDSFVPVARPKPPASAAEWQVLQQQFMTALREKSFRAWPELPPVDNSGLHPVFNESRKGVRFQAWDIVTEDPFRLRLYVASAADSKLAELDLMVLNVLDEDGWREFVTTMNVAFADQLKDSGIPAKDDEGFEDLSRMFGQFKWGHAWFAPRGIGLTRWSEDPRKLTQIRRRFPLLGMTQDSARVFDTRRMIQAIRSIDGLADRPLWLQSSGQMAGISLYASLFEPDIQRLDLYDLPTTHHNGPVFLNVMRFLDMPQAVALAVARSKVRLYSEDQSAWDWVARSIENADLPPGNFQLRETPAD